MIQPNLLSKKWPHKKLQDVAIFLDGMRKPIKSSDRTPGPYPYYGANGQQGTIDKYIFDEPIILLAEDGGHFRDPERGIAYKVTGRSWVNNHAHVLKAKSDIIDLDYLCYHLRHYNLIKFISGSTRDKLTKGSSLEIPVLLPPINEQLKIVNLLQMADRILSLRNKSLAQLDGLIHSTFIEMFGDPKTNPKKWKMRKIGDLIDSIESGKSLASPKEATNDCYRVLKVSAVTWGKYDPNESKPMSASYIPPNKNHVVKAGDFLFTRANTAELVGAVAIVRKTPLKMLLPDKIWRINWKESITKEFACYMLRSPEIRRLMSGDASGTSGSMKNISQSKLSNISIFLPDIKMQNDFSCFVLKSEILQEKLEDSINEAENLYRSCIISSFEGN